MAKIIRVETWHVATCHDLSNAYCWTVYKTYYDSGTCVEWTDRHSEPPQTVLDFMDDHFCLEVCDDFDYVFDEGYPSFYRIYNLSVYADDDYFTSAERFHKEFELRCIHL